MDAFQPHLSRRMKQTLDFLRLGLAEKEVATELGLSQHTVHVYVKQLYRVYGVCTRSELLSLWTGMLGPVERPQLTLASLRQRRYQLLVEIARIDREIAEKIEDVPQSSQLVPGSSARTHATR